MQLVSTKLSSKNQVVAPREVSWTDYTAGLGKKAWQGLEAAEYINKLRDEWVDT